jgi:MYXO-CTERM domain-containing protein
MKRALGTIALGGVFFAALGCGNPSVADPSEEEHFQQRQRIVGGIPDLNHRYTVSINGCSGTLISKYTVLTAGHCYGSISSVSFGNRASAATKTIQIASKKRDPLYEEICDQDATYDLAIAKLAEPAPFQPAPLLRATLDNSKKYIGPSWVWVGFGLTAQGGSSGTKRVTTFPVELVGPAPGKGSLCEIPDTLVYYTANGRNTCNGDSGGPSYFVYGGVEYLAGVTSSGDNSCTLDGTQQRSDLPHVMRFIQAEIDANEGTDPCRSNGVCDETCNVNGQIGDPDCHAAHCGADGICAEACVAPRDPDCASVDSDNCGDNGVCDLKCATDPDCTRDCAAEGNCIPNCPTPDPDCAAQDGGTTIPDSGSTDGGGVADAPSRDVAAPDATSGDANTADTIAPPPDATTPPTDSGPRDTTGGGDTARDTASRGDAPANDGSTTSDSSSPDGAGGAPGDGAAGAGGGAGNAASGGAGGTGGSSGDNGAHEDPSDGPCGCRTVGAPAGSTRIAWSALALGAIALRRRARRRTAD